MSGLAHVAMAALLLQRGATVEELEPVLAQLAPHPVPDHLPHLVANVDSAIDWIRVNRPVGGAR